MKRIYKKFNNLNVRHKLFVSTSVIVTPIFLALLIISGTILSVYGLSSEIVDETFGETVPIVDISKNLEKVLTKVNSYPYTDDVPSLSGVIEVDLLLIKDKIEEFLGSDVVKSKKEKSIFVGVVGDIDRHLQAVSKIAYSNNISVKSKTLARSIEFTINNIDAAYIKSLSEIDELRDELSKSFLEIAIILIICFLSFIALLVFVLLGLSNIIVNPISELVESIKSMSDGDMDKRVSVDTSIVEFRELATAFNDMAENVNNITNIDSLTKIANRREFDRRINDECSRYDRYGHSFAVLLIDIDYFKDVNDRFGHQAGDKVLEIVSQIMAEAVRPADLVARYGGEEFAVILPGAAWPGAYLAAERIRSQIEEASIQVSDDEDIAVTVSIGAAIIPDDAKVAWEAISIADEHLYDAKRSGRNCIRPKKLDKVGN